MGWRGVAWEEHRGRHHKNTAGSVRHRSGQERADAARRLRETVLSTRSLLDGERTDLASFLSGSEGSGYVPQSGEIVGLLKQLKDSMSASLADITATERQAIQAYDELMAAKEKEVLALTKSIESKSER